MARLAMQFRLVKLLKGISLLRLPGIYPMDLRILLNLLLVLTILGMATPVRAFWPFDDNKNDDGNKAPKRTEVRVDDRSSNRDARFVTSFAPIARMVSPSVVGITVIPTQKSDAPKKTPQSNDPFFRYFFGNPEQEGGSSDAVNGSGIIVSADGYILTNGHVTMEGADIFVTLPSDTRRRLKATLVGSDPKTDIAILRIEGANYPAITFGDSDKVEVGDVVLAVGNPFGLGQTVTMGIISAKGRQTSGVDNDPSLPQFQDFLQTDAAINPGNSGGPLVDAEGRLIGINTLIYSPTGVNLGIGFSVPVNLARSIMTQIIEKGKVTRGFLGVKIQEIDDNLAQAFKLKDSRGALVTEIIPGGAAEAAGMKRGDAIIQFNGVKVDDMRELQFKVAQLQPGEKAKLTVLREGKEVGLTVQLKEYADEEEPATPAKEDFTVNAASNLLDGVEVADVDARMVEKLGLPKNSTGAIVVKVEPSSPAAEGGLEPGDIITEMDQKPILTAKEAITASKQIQSSQIILYVVRKGSGRYVVVKAPPK
jgi:serine protease Do